MQLCILTAYAQDERLLPCLRIICILRIYTSFFDKPAGKALTNFSACSLLVTFKVYKYFPPLILNLV